MSDDETKPANVQPSASPEADRPMPSLYDRLRAMTEHIDSPVERRRALQLIDDVEQSNARVPIC